jgi:uncharacterized repeat protein (TIGR03803 family)
MKNSVPWQDAVSGAGRRVATVLLVMAVMLLSIVVVPSSAQAQTYKESVLYSFAGAPDGANPYAGLILDAKGNLYGTTQGGGADGYGTVFKYDPTTKKETVLYSFTGAPDGAGPFAGLIFNAKGNLYGTTQGGGASGDGTVFKYDPTTKKETVLYSFTGAPDGAGPYAGLILDAKGNFWGTTSGDGADGYGTVFKYDPTTKKETVLYSFTGAPDGGAGPYASLIPGANGNLYGTTAQGGINDVGTVFKYDPTTKNETVLHSFTGGADGALPLYSGLILDAKGNFWGTTVGGGADGYGTVFKYDPTTKKEAVLYGFTGAPDGATPVRGVILDANGNFYGTTTVGGTSGDGTVFKYDPRTKKETVLYNFTGAPDGSTPVGDLILDASGNLYGTTSQGGASNDGTVFKLTPSK